MMRAFKNEHDCESITERWEAVDAYLECVTSCGLYDGVCVTTCITKHLEPGTELKDEVKFERKY
ncbi:hypothetical protein Syn8016DRAFT_0550 [Synechococcus sp. WH 8016]|nr:hypothetical protein Syn8016DRAFT_0550 [Synechococcus sp. WH 8016]